MIDQFIDAAAIGDVDAVRAMLAGDPSLVRASDGNQFTALHGVAGQDDIQMAELLIAAGAEVSARNDVGMTPLHIAQYASIVDVLVRHGADVNARAMRGWTPLHVQAQESYDTGALEVMEALLDAGADPNLKDDDGRTPFDLAAARDEVEKLDLLRSRGGSSQS